MEEGLEGLRKKGLALVVRMEGEEEGRKVEGRDRRAGGGRIVRRNKQRRRRRKGQKRRRWEVWVKEQTEEKGK